MKQAGIQGGINFSKYSVKNEIDILTVIQKEVPSLLPETMKSSVNVLDRKIKKRSRFRRHCG